MAGRDWIPVVAAAIVFAGTYLASWLKDRNNPMTQVVTSANATTAAMHTLLAPMQAEIAALRAEIVTLRTHVVLLEAQIRLLGHEPLSPPQLHDDDSPGTGE